MAQDVGGRMVDDPHQLLGVFQFVPTAPLGHGVNAGHHVIEFGQYIIGMVKFPTFEDVRFNPVKESEIHAIIGPVSVVLLDGATLLKEVVCTRPIGNFEGR